MTLRCEIKLQYVTRSSWAHKKLCKSPREIQLSLSRWPGAHTLRGISGHTSMHVHHDEAIYGIHAGNETNPIGQQQLKNIQTLRVWARGLGVLLPVTMQTFSILLEK